MNALSKRLDTLESAANPKRATYCFWAMTDACQPMNEKQIDAVIADAIKRGHAARSDQFISVRWLAPSSHD